MNSGQRSLGSKSTRSPNQLRLHNNKSIEGPPIGSNRNKTPAAGPLVEEEAVQMDNNQGSSALLIAHSNKGNVPVVKVVWLPKKVGTWFHLHPPLFLQPNHIPQLLPHIHPPHVELLFSVHKIMAKGRQEGINREERL